MSENNSVGLKTTFGIDISNWQRGLSLKQAKNEGIQVSVLKAGGADGVHGVHCKGGI